MNQSKDQPALCELCGEPMPLGEETFRYHGYSGDCPKPYLSEQAKEEKEPNPHDNKDRDKLRENVDVAIGEDVAIRVDQGQPYIFTTEFATDRIMKLIDAYAESRVEEAKIETAKKILHKGWCIPEMEVQVEDFINSLTDNQERRSNRDE